MELMGRKKLVVIFLSILLAISSGALINEFSEFEEPSRMTILTPIGFEPFGMNTNDQAGSEYWQYLVHASLLSKVYSISGDDSPIPELAQSLPEVVEQDDGTTISSITLKPNLKFSSGNPLTTEDVLFSYNYIMTQAISDYYSPWFFSKYFESNSSITAEGNTINFHFKHYDTYVEKVYNIWIFEKAVYQPVIDGCVQNSTLCDGWSVEENFGIQAQGAGPYKIKWYNNVTQELILEKNQYYWDSEKVFVEELLYRNVKEFVDVESLVNNSTIDLISVLYYLNETTLEAYPAFNSYDEDKLGSHEIRLNHNHPIFGSGINTPIGQSDPLQAYYGAKYVRKALAHLLDRQGIVDNIYLGLAEPGVTSVPPDSSGFDDSLSPYPYNVSIAKSLMKRAGYNYSLLVDENGDSLYDNSFFNITLHTPDWYPKRIEWSWIFVKEAAKIGIEVNNILENHTTYTSPDRWVTGYPIELSDKGGFDLMVYGWGSSKNYELEGEYTNESEWPFGSNFENYVNNSLGVLANDYTNELDKSTRNAILYDIQYHFLDEVVHISVVYPINLIGLHCRMASLEERVKHFGLTWKDFKIDYSSCPAGIAPDFVDDLINSPAIYLILPGTVSGLILIGLLVNKLVSTKVEKEIRQLPAKEKAMTKDYLEKARKIAEKGGDFEEDQYPEDFSDTE